MERALEQRPFLRETIHVRRDHERMAAGAEFVVAQVVDQDDQEVGLAVGHDVSLAVRTRRSLARRAPVSYSQPPAIVPV
jgi:hypothetical protein